MKLVLILLLFSIQNSLCQEVAFTKIGTFCGRDNHGNLVEKSYYGTNLLRATWINAVTTCKAFDLELATFETLNEASTVNSMIWSYKYLFTDVIHIGGVTKNLRSSTDWYWINTDERVSFSIPWYPGQPSGSGDVEFCLSLILSQQSVKFNDVYCYNSDVICSFLCQKIDSFVESC